MQLRLLLLTLLPLGLSSCFGPPQDVEVYPYGPPRYGHRGTDSPPPPGPLGAPPYQQGPQQADPNQGAYQWGNQGANQDPNQGGGAVTQNRRNRPPRQEDPVEVTPTPNVPTPNVPDPAPTVARNDPPPKDTTSGGSTPYGIPVPGKDGMLYSPFKPDAGFIDITTRNSDGSTATLPPGTKIKDPFSGKAILVP